MSSEKKKLTLLGAAMLGALSIAGYSMNSMSAFAHEAVYVEHAAHISRTPPAYPAYAQDNGLEGFVELEFVIQRDGRVDAQSIRVINARPEGIFDDSARDAISRWQFEPGQQPRRATQRLLFQLR